MAEAQEVVSSHSFAQHFVECNRCPQSAKVYCNTCKEKMCLPCQEKHMENLSGQYHEIILYSKSRQPNQNLAGQCAVHVGMRCIMHCQECDMQVCANCIEKEHQRHFLVQRKRESSTQIAPLAEAAKFMINNFGICRHISCSGSDKALVSDSDGNLVMVDVTGKEHYRIKLNKQSGYCVYTLANFEEILFTEEHAKCVKKVIVGKDAETLLRVGEWTPMCLSASRSTGEIIVGMWKEEVKKKEKLFKSVKTKHTRIVVAKFNRSGEEKQLIEFHNDKKPLFHWLYYLTENEKNGDICTSDYYGRSTGAVVVVDKWGKYRFSYTGKSDSTEFWPSGICTDALGNVLVYELHSHGVHVIDSSGKCLSLLETHSGSDLYLMQGLCVDDTGRLWCGDNKHVKVYEYLCN